MGRDVTSIEVKTSTWRELNRRKEPGDSFDDVIGRVLAGSTDDGSVSSRTDASSHGAGLRCPDCGQSFDDYDQYRQHVENPAVVH